MRLLYAFPLTFAGVRGSKESSKIPPFFRQFRHRTKTLLLDMGNVAAHPRVKCREIRNRQGGVGFRQYRSFRVAGRPIHSEEA
jgi:hypothetical protein